MRFAAPSERCSGRARRRSIWCGRGEASTLIHATASKAASYPSTTAAVAGREKPAAPPRAAPARSTVSAWGGTWWNYSLGTSTRSKVRSTHLSAVMPSISDSGLNTIRWRSTGAARSRTSSGVT